MRNKIILNSGKEQSLKRFHPWVFSGAIKKIVGEVKEGDAVDVFSNKDEYLGTGHYQKGSISVRIFSFKHEKDNLEFWKNKIQHAYQFRKQLGLIDNPQTNAYRLLFAEGDLMPGLIVDYYNGTAVIQCHSVGMYNIREQIAEALKEVYGKKLLAIYDKSHETLPKQGAITGHNEYLFGNTENTEVLEYGNKFSIDWIHGQKTGFFIDQRENRKTLAEFSKGKRVLNTFCYTGGFSVYALNAGATEVHSVDSSHKAIDLTNKNVELNGFSDKHKAFAEDTFDFLDGKANEYDVIILDPPAFAKHHNVRHNAMMGYKRINTEAIKQIKKGGILFTFSCSGVVDKNMFNSTVMSAAIVAGRNARVIGHLSQPADHPVNIFHPEGEYLKGLILSID